MGVLFIYYSTCSSNTHEEEHKTLLLDLLMARSNSAVSQDYMRKEIQQVNLHIKNEFLLIFSQRTKYLKLSKFIIDNQ
jgi:hypothetical protein